MAGRLVPTDVAPADLRSVSSEPEIRGRVGDIHRVLAEHLEWDQVEDRLMRRRKHDRCGDTVVVGTEPVARRDTPAVSGNQARKVELGHGSRQIVSDPALMFEELGGHDGTYRVAANIACVGVARTLAEESRQGIHAAGVQRIAEHVEGSHGGSIAQL